MMLGSWWKWWKWWWWMGKGVDALELGTIFKQELRCANLKVPFEETEKAKTMSVLAEVVPRVAPLAALN